MANRKTIKREGGITLTASLMRGKVNPHNEVKEKRALCTCAN